MRIGKNIGRNARRRRSYLKKGVLPISQTREFERFLLILKYPFKDCLVDRQEGGRSQSLGGGCGAG
jgi:hypothetical protein